MSQAQVKLNLAGIDPKTVSITLENQGEGSCFVVGYPGLKEKIKYTCHKRVKPLSVKYKFEFGILTLDFEHTEQPDNIYVIKPCPPQIRDEQDKPCNEIPVSEILESIFKLNDPW